MKLTATTHLLVYVHSFTIIYTISAFYGEKAEETMEQRLCRIAGWGRAKWENGTCKCSSPCASNPPICSKMNCHGAPVGGFISKSAKYCVTSACPVGRSGTCCEITTCLHGGKKGLHGRCLCNGTGYIGQFCQERIRHCRNGGRKSFQANRCSCTENFEGEECEIPICYNKGKAVGDDCKCRRYDLSRWYEDVFYGNFCENIKCKNGETRVDHKRKTTVYECMAFFTGHSCDSLSNLALLTIVFCCAGLGVCCCCAVAKHKQRKGKRRSMYAQQITEEETDRNQGHNLSKYEDPRLPQNSTAKIIL